MVGRKKVIKLKRKKNHRKIRDMKESKQNYKVTVERWQKNNQVETVA